ncbi:MFS transporter [Pigmentiphaga sp. NML080357]|uniref:MFS transporter n=1 Tax=Pigmentiphaga sp. NML080357 TaxID=2008675 RepID=UPI000B40AFAE|nr:MFS transporter [Pigmentiphaga sp. NML080357]OVZ57158.1 MFS transporter [Pigmentiphaga sp. NML080357]
MFAYPVSRWLARRGIHFSWVMVALAFLTMLSSSAALGLPGAFLQPLAREFGWNVDQISSALAVRFALFGLMGPFSAILMERYGLRRIMCAAMILVAAGLLLATQMSEVWHLVALWGLLLGFGTGLTAVVLGAVVATRWFDRRRGLVLGLLTASAATGQLVFLPAAAWLIDHFGWRAAVVPVVVCCLAVAALAFLLARNRPQDLGLLPYGADPDAPAPAAAPSRPSFLAPLTVLRSVSGSKTFWVLFGTFFVCGLSTNGLIQTHFISLCGDFGLAAVPAASVLAMMGAFDFVGTILSGWLSDRFDNRKLLFWYYGLRGLSLFWLPHSEFTLYGLSLFAMFYGLDWIATVPPTVKLAAAEFGKERAGMVFGWVFAGHQIGGAIAAYGAGVVRTQMLTYTPALYAAGAACLVAALIVFLIRRPAAAPVAAPASGTA